MVSTLPARWRSVLMRRTSITGYEDNAVAVFSRDRTTGKLTFLEVHRDGFGKLPELVAVCPDKVPATSSAQHLRNTVTKRAQPLLRICSDYAQDFGAVLCYTFSRKLVSHPLI
jgi:hypothetical protein